MTKILTLDLGPKGAEKTLILAHGAGAAMDSPFMNIIAEGLARQAIRIIRFEFPYMAERRISGKKSPPNRQPILLECWQQIIDQTGIPSNLYIGGKSMGGRMASLIADDIGAKGLICLGYPFHPPAKPDKLRTEHLINIKTPTLICQGERDPFGTKEEVVNYGLSSNIHFFWAPDGDHSLKPRKRSGFTEKNNLLSSISSIANFLRLIE